MVSPMLLTAFLLTAQGTPPQSRAYSSCLNSFIRAQVAEQVEEAAFRDNLRSACPSEEAAFRFALIAADVAAGTTRAAAEQNANERIEAYHEHMIETFKDAQAPTSDNQ